VVAAPVLGDMIAANGTPAWAKLAGNITTTRKVLRQASTGSVSALPTWDTLLAGDLPAHTHAESDVANLTTDLGGKAASVHTHAESDVTGLVTDLAAKAAKAGDTFTGTLRVGGDQAYLECGPYQTIGGAFENMAKYSEDFSVGTWDKNGGATLTEIMQKMSWQKHTVRGFMAGAMKKAGYAIESFKPDGGERTYRINR
jgi:hypothetical protein